jgi:CheY-like chemotaxis protein
VVDDRDDDVTLTAWALRKIKASQSLHQVMGGKQAIDYLNGEGPYSDRDRFPLPQLILLDLKMPEVTGFEVLSWIRQQNHIRSTPVVILSGSVWSRDAARAYQLGANSYLQKPGALEDFVAMMRVVHEYWFTLTRLPSQVAKPGPLTA